jgi:hypothetical protein
MSYTDIVICIGPDRFLETWPPIYRGYERPVRDRPGHLYIGTDFLLLANNSSEVDGNQISFGTINFQPHPPNFTPIFESLDQEMDLTI